MLLLKTSGKTIGEVVKRAKHATHTKPNAQQGDLVLIAQTKSTLKPGQKSIRYIMTYKGYRLDTRNESQRIWSRKWKYMIDGNDVIEIPGFDIKDIQVSDKNYDFAQTHDRLKQEDEEAVLSYLSKRVVYERARPAIGRQAKSPEEILQELRMISSRSSDVAIAKSKRYYRDPRKSTLLKELYD
jgi:hypothetical protein